jgi:cytochrome b involved in lipid metabolism
VVFSSYFLARFIGPYQLLAGFNIRSVCSIAKQESLGVTMSHKLTHADVAAHTGRHDLYVIIHGKVLDLSNFVDEHP